jgi:predicted phage terminase large subunit-like protein
VISNPIVTIAEEMLKHYEPPPPPPPPRWESPGKMAKAMEPSTVQTPALDLIDQALVDFELGDCDRLMIWMPPQEGKSERVSRRYVEWALERNKDLRFAIVSYADEMARRWGSDIKQDVELFNGLESTIDLGLKLREDSRAAGRWQILNQKGGVYCVGVAGALTGKPVDRLVIDDPIKDLEQAQSSRYRERAKNFWKAVAVPRLGPNSKCVIIQTRWHEDDLSGWLLREGLGGRWKVIRIPAIAEEPHAVFGADPLGRKPGTPMVSARGNRDWGQIRADVGEYVWAALYQQRPAPAAGGLFKRARLRYWHGMPVDVTRHDPMGGQRIDLAGRPIYLGECWRFITMDLAASEKTSADFTAVGVWAITMDGDLVLLDGDSARIEETGHWDLVRPLREKWMADTVFVESRMFGTTLVYEAGANHIPVSELKADTDKVTRALPATARTDSGRLWLPAADTGTLAVAELVDQLTQFPNAVHDDWVDVVSYAARVVAAHWVPPVNSPRASNGNGNGRETINQAYEAATGSTGGRTDYSRMEW